MARGWRGGLIEGRQERDALRERQKALFFDKHQLFISIQWVPVCDFLFLFVCLWNPFFLEPISDKWSWDAPVDPVSIDKSEMQFSSVARECVCVCVCVGKEAEMKTEKCVLTHTHTSFLSFILKFNWKINYFYFSCRSDLYFHLQN